MKDTQSECQVKMLKEVPSLTDMPWSLIKKEMLRNIASWRLSVIRSESPTVTWANMVCLDSSMDIPLLILTVWPSGRHSSVILPMELLSLLITLLPVVRLNGVSKTDLFCHFLMVWTVRDLNTVKVELNDSYNFLMTIVMSSKIWLSRNSSSSTTCRSSTVQQHLITSMHWEDSSTETIVNLWLPSTQRNCLNLKGYSYCYTGKYTSQSHHWRNWVCSCLCWWVHHSLESQKSTHGYRSILLWAQKQERRN